jgi:hypothetical protein
LRPVGDQFRHRRAPAGGVRLAVPAAELATWLDDIFHEYAGYGDNVDALPD